MVTISTQTVRTVNVFLITFVILFGLLHFNSNSNSQKYLPEIPTTEARLFPISPERTLTQATIIEAIQDTSEKNVIQKSIIGFRLEIPSLNITAPIVLEPTTKADNIYKQLEKGVVHYASTPLPGEPGTAIILGHSSHYPWYKGNYGFIFASLSKLKIGDTFEIQKNGQVLKYKVDRLLIFSPKDINNPELMSLEKTNGSSIILMTCWPNGTNAKRVAVRADLISI